LMNPPRLETLPEIAEIAEWFHWAAELPRVESQQLTVSAAREAEPSIKWNCLAIAGRNRLPATFHLDPATWGLQEVVKATLPADAAIDELTVDETEERQRNIRLNRIYWRSLETALPESERPSSECSPCYSMFFKCGPEAAAKEEFALLLLRYTTERRIRAPWHPWVKGHYIQSDPHACEFPEERLNYSVRWTTKFTCSPLQKRWLKDRFFFETLRALFAAALQRTCIMAESKEYRLEDLSRLFEVYRPYCTGMFNSKGILEFWSLRVRLEPKWNCLDRRLGLRIVSRRGSDV
jgi:hypothetical protein